MLLISTTATTITLTIIAASIAFEVWKCVDRSGGGVVVGFVLGIFPPSSLARSLAIPYIFFSLIFFFLFKCDLSTIPSLEASRDRSFILLSSFLCSYSVPSFICIPSFLSSFLSGRNRSSCFLPSFVHTPFLPLCAFVPSFLHIPSFPGIGMFIVLPSLLSSYSVPSFIRNLSFLSSYFFLPAYSPSKPWKGGIACVGLSTTLHQKSSTVVGTVCKLICGARGW